VVAAYVAGSGVVRIGVDLSADRECASSVSYRFQSIRPVNMKNSQEAQNDIGAEESWHSGVQVFI
jgi:hypothetical protein